MLDKIVVIACDNQRGYVDFCVDSIPNNLLLFHGWKHTGANVENRKDWEMLLRMWRNSWVNADSLTAGMKASRAVPFAPRWTAANWTFPDGKATGMRIIKAMEKMPSRR